MTDLTKPDSTMKGLGLAYDRLALWLEKFNLIPLVVVVSVYHYYQALALHDPFYIAAPIALFVDLLHYRTVQRAVNTQQVSWVITATLTSGLAFGLQLAFYTERFAVFPPESFLYALIVPFGVAVWGWMHGTNGESPALKLYRARRKAFLLALNRRKSAVNQLELALNQAESQMNQDKSKLNNLESTVMHLESKLMAVEESARRSEAMIAAVNPITRDVMRHMAFGELHGKEIAERHGVSPATISGIKSKLNGHK